MTNEPIQTDKFLTVDDTRIMKAVAITLMLMHHLWCFGTRTAGEPLEYLFTIFGIPSTIYFGFFGKICVPMFFFFGGYGTYLSQFGKKFDLVGKLKKLYFAYWKVFLILPGSIPATIKGCSNLCLLNLQAHVTIVGFSLMTLWREKHQRVVVTQFKVY